VSVLYVLPVPDALPVSAHMRPTLPAMMLPVMGAGAPGAGSPVLACAAI
jgi:hypothetical protein